MFSKFVKNWALKKKMKAVIKVRLLFRYHIIESQ